MTHTYGATNYKRGAFVGGFEHHALHDPETHANKIQHSREEAQFVADTWPKMPAPLHKFYVTQVAPERYTLSVHVENLEQAIKLFEKYDRLTLHPLNDRED